MTRILAKTAVSSEGMGIPVDTLLAWPALASLAIGGSLASGASLCLAFPHWNALHAALWLTLSAGLSWLVFAPCLVVVARRTWIDCIDSCLVTMAWGELVLLAGTLGNLLFAHAGLTNPVAFNIGAVAVSNALMAGVLVARMAQRGVPVAATLFLWLVALDGAGALFFYGFRFLVETRQW